MQLTNKQVREILEKYFPGEEWNSATDEECSVCLGERCGPFTLETDLDGQYIIYTDVHVEETSFSNEIDPDE